MTEMMDFINRSGADSGTSEELDIDQNVELEKSNVLLMGPTGSGTACNNYIAMLRCHFVLGISTT